MSNDEYYLDIALAVAKKSTCLKKHFGTVIVSNSEIIATGFNGPPRHEPHCTVCTKCDSGKDEATYLSCPAVHAEQNAMLSASRKEMLGSTLYLAGWYADGKEFVEAMPCEICLRLIKNAGISKVVNRTGLIYNRDPDGILRKCK